MRADDCKDIGFHKELFYDERNPHITKEWKRFL
jgi:hypothetical protein